MRIADPKYTVTAYYTQVIKPNELNREEKDELLFALVELLECRMLRADSNPVDVILLPPIPKE